MSKGRDRNIYKRGDKWVNKRQDSDRASSLHHTQQEAVEVAREMLINQGGGELSIHGRNGAIRRKVTVGDGNDPFPPKDK